MSDIITAFFLITGALFMLVASIGLVRLPDLYMRMHAATKSLSMGMMLMLVSIVIYQPELYVIIKAFLTICFIFLTAPLASHMISKVARGMNIPYFSKEKKNT